jgi:hypothetical protein
MTGSEWNACADPQAMLDALEDAARTGTGMGAAGRRVSDRKLRLFACACCRQVWDRLADPRSRRAVEVAERYADGAAAEEEVTDAGRDAALARIHMHPVGEGPWAAAYLASTAICPLQDGEWGFPGELPDAVNVAVGMLGTGVAATWAAILRDVAGNPWRPVTLPDEALCRRCLSWFAPAKKRHYQCPACDAPGPFTRACRWLTPTVLSLAHAAYDERPGRACEKCGGDGFDGRRADDDQYACAGCGRPAGQYGHHSERSKRLECPECPTCRGTGRFEDGTLDPHRLAVLADALEEAGCPQRVTCHGCDNESGYRIHCDVCEGKGHAGTLPHPLLAHLRSPGPHVRGCWCVDLILGKS